MTPCDSLHQHSRIRRPNTDRQGHYRRQLLASRQHHTSRQIERCCRDGGPLQLDPARRRHRHASVSLRRQSSSARSTSGDAVVRCPEEASSTTASCDQQSLAPGPHQYAGEHPFLSTTGPNSALIKDLPSTNFQSVLTPETGLNLADIGGQVCYRKGIIASEKQPLQPAILYPWHPGTYYSNVKEVLCSYLGFKNSSYQKCRLEGTREDHQTSLKRSGCLDNISVTSSTNDTCHRSPSSQHHHHTSPSHTSPLHHHHHHHTISSQSAAPPSTTQREEGSSQQHLWATTSSPLPPVASISSLPKMMLGSNMISFVSQSWLTALILLSSVFVPGAVCSQYGDAEHITAILGEAVVLNCPVSQPDTPYIIQWKRQHYNIPIYIWYDGYDPHVEEAYKGRASRVNTDTTLGLASLNLTSVKEDDQGWYECKVFYLDRTGATDNGTWIHLDVHAPPRFTTTPDDVTYVNIGDSIILNCEAEGTPKPEIFWFRDDETVTPRDTVGIFNDGTELRINKIRDQDIGDYLCVARNAEGRVHHAAKVVIAGGAVIITPPHNITRQEGEKAEFPCEAKALPGNVTVTWKREDVPINRLSWLDTRSIVRRDGTLIINPTSADDGGFFTCEVSNGIGTPQRATAYLNVEYPARVTYTPTVQYLPFRQQGIVKCHIKANPEVQFVTWIKDKRLFEPDTEPGVIKLNNGSLLITKVNESFQGRYSCTPYNKHTTAGSSGDMEVLVREPPEFSPRPQPQYHGQVGEEVTLVCGGSGTLTPTVTWRRRDGQNLPRDRTESEGGNLTIKSLRKSDHAFYECEVKNEILAIMASTQLLVEGTTPHPPNNITTKTSAFSVQLSWEPGYPGGRDWDQKYTIWYRTLGQTTWSQIEVKPPGSTLISIHSLTPGSTYEFQVQGKNELGDGMFSDIITATTEGEAPPSANTDGNIYGHNNGNPNSHSSNPTPNSGGGGGGDQSNTQGPVVGESGPKPAPPRNVTIRKTFDGYTLSWEAPLGSVPIAYYDIEFRGSGSWKALNKEKIVNETSYTARKLTPGKSYRFRVIAKTLTSFQSSEEIVYEIEVHDKEKAVTAALVGGMLLCIVAIILSVCTVKICNKRKRKKQEKAYNMVACRVSETKNGGHGGSPVPLKKLLRCGISSVRDLRYWLAGVLLGTDFFDTTDSRPLGSVSSSHYDADSYKRYGVERHRKFPKDTRYSVHAEYKQAPIPEIARSDEGKFILDKDSDEGGFTSPRRPARGILGKRNFQDWTEPPESGWTAAVAGIESGVYHVRRGTTTHLHQNLPQPPRLSLRSEGSGASTYELPRNIPGSPVIYENSMMARRPFGDIYYIPSLSPQFGQHMIPTSPSRPVLSPKGRLMSSSPGPLSTQWKQLTQLASFNEVSSVKQPSSVERSFPSTVISSFHTPNQHTPSIHALSMEAQSPYFQFPSQPSYSRELPALSPLYKYPDNRKFHLVGAQVHEPPLRFRSRPAYHPYYLPPPRYYSPWGTPQRPVYDRRFGWISPHQAGIMARHALLGSGQHVHHVPQPREIFSHFQPTYTNESTRHYVNLPPMRRDTYQHHRTPGKDPRILLKPPPPPSSENQKPLATSSPPRLRPRGFSREVGGVSSLQQPPRAVPESISPNVSQTSLMKRHAHKTNVLPYAAQKDVASVRHRVSRRTRHHSAPDLSISINDDVEVGPRVRLPSGRSRRSGDNKSRSHEASYDMSQEFSQDQSPDSSSGFGSKNTSHQQSSSQSGQSLSALGLDTSRVSETSLKAVKPDQQSEVRRLGLEPQIWPPPRLPPSYEQWLARQMQPQFRVPSINYEYPTSRGKTNNVPFPSDRTNPSAMLRTNRSTVYTHPTSIDELENDVFESVDSADNTLINATVVAPLDISVDDHYEFDTMLSPTPLDEGLMPSGGDWSSNNDTSLRRLSDSELYGTGSSLGDKRRRSQESMEERVAAMKQEFLAYRRRQAERGETQLESVC